MTKMKFMRPGSYRFKKERALMDKYKESTLYYAGLDYKLGSLVARSGSMVKGYGKVRRRTIKAFYRFIDNIIFPLSEFERNKRKNYDITLEVGEEALKLVSGESVEGIDKAEKLAREIMEQRAA